MGTPGLCSVSSGSCLGDLKGVSPLSLHVAGLVFVADGLEVVELLTLREAASRGQGQALGAQHPFCH